MKLEYIVLSSMLRRRNVEVKWIRLLNPEFNLKLNKNWTDRCEGIKKGI